MNKSLTCIECPMGCYITVDFNGDKITLVTGNACKRGEAYAKQEVICPMRVITTTVKVLGGGVLPVKTDNPVKKQEMFEVIKKINEITVNKSIKIGDVIYKDIVRGVNLVATNNL